MLVEWKPSEDGIGTQLRVRYYSSSRREKDDEEVNRKKFFLGEDEMLSVK